MDPPKDPLEPLRQAARSLALQIPRRPEVGIFVAEAMHLADGRQHDALTALHAIQRRQDLLFFFEGTTRDPVQGPVKGLRGALYTYARSIIDTRSFNRKEDAQRLLDDADRLGPAGFTRLLGHDVPKHARQLSAARVQTLNLLDASGSDDELSLLREIQAVLAAFEESEEWALEALAVRERAWQHVEDIAIPHFIEEPNPRYARWLDLRTQIGRVISLARPEWKGLHVRSVAHHVLAHGGFHAA